jgi:hypothetical protein
VTVDLENLPDEPAALMRVAAAKLRESVITAGGRNLAALLEQAAEVVEHGEPEPDPAPPRGGHFAEHLGVWVSYYDDWSAFAPHQCELDALRAAVDPDGRGDHVLFVRWGQAGSAAAVEALRAARQEAAESDAT